MREAMDRIRKEIGLADVSESEYRKILSCIVIACEIIREPS